MFVGAAEGDRREDEDRARAIVALGRWQVYIGQFVFILGVSWYGLVMRTRAIAAGLGALADIILLRRLWIVAAAVIARFLPVRRLPGFRTWQPLSSLLERPQAMMVDIRDALLLLGPQVDPAAATTVLGYARELRRVAAANFDRPVLYGEPVRAAVDTADTFDSDRKLLVTLAAHLRAEGLQDAAARVFWQRARVAGRI